MKKVIGYLRTKFNRSDSQRAVEEQDHKAEERTAQAREEEKAKVAYKLSEKFLVRSPALGDIIKMAVIAASVDLIGDVDREIEGFIDLGAVSPSVHTS